MCCFQLFQLTALVVRGPSELHPIFTVSLDGVAMNHEKAEGAVACVQDFVRHPLFTQRIFLSKTGIGMLNTAVAAADAVRHSSEFDPCRAIGVEAGPVKVSGDSRAAMEGSQGYTGALVWCKLLHHQLLVTMRPARLSAFLMLLR